MSSKPKAEEIVESLTGWDEIAIEQASGKTLEEMQDRHQILMVRCLAAVVEWRELLEDNPDAKFAAVFRAVMARPQKEVQGRFDMGSDDDLMPDDPDTESGKDDCEPGSAPMTSLSSVSSQESTPGRITA